MLSNSRLNVIKYQKKVSMRNVM